MLFRGSRGGAPTCIGIETHPEHPARLPVDDTASTRATAPPRRATATHNHRIASRRFGRGSSGRGVDCESRGRRQRALPWNRAAPAPALGPRCSIRRTTRRSAVRWTRILTDRRVSRQRPPVASSDGAGTPQPNHAAAAALSTTYSRIAPGSRVRASDCVGPSGTSGPIPARPGRIRRCEMVWPRYSCGSARARESRVGHEGRDRQREAHRDEGDM